jgi:purine-nucleoside phosphorylase
MTEVYDKSFIKIAEKISEAEKITLQKGVYTGLTGPSLETSAEIRYLKNIGGDAVGFSTIMEAIIGVHAGMKVLGLATITNINNPDEPQKASIEEIIATAQKASEKVNTLVSGIIKEL